MRHRFIGPRYETSTKICQFQEYLFQWATLSKMFIVVVISNSIFRAIKYGDLSTWRNNFFYVYCGVFVFVCVIFSIAFNTAEIFCPFNENEELYYKHWKNDIPSSYIAISCCYFLPLIIGFNVAVFYSTLSIYISRYRKSVAINSVLKELGLYPILLVLCVVPILAFIAFVIQFGHQNLLLWHSGVFLVNCGGIFVGIVYLVSTRKAKFVPKEGAVQSSAMITSVAENRHISHASTVRNTTVTIKLSNLSPAEGLLPYGTEFMNLALLSDYDNYCEDELYLTFSP